MSAAAEPDPSQPNRPRYSRFFFNLDVDIPIDPATGLLQGPYSVQAAGGLSLIDLVEQRFTLLIGPPYAGKSTVLQQLVGETLSGRQVLFSDLRSLLEIKPDGWGQWVEMGGPRLWCIDSLDENRRGALSVLTMLKGLSPQRRSELNLLVSCRENEVPATFATDVSRALEAKCSEVRIAPPDRAEAEVICGPENLERVLLAIRSRDLREVAGQPAALEWLSKQTEIALQTATKGTLWKGIIDAILEPKPAHVDDPGARHTLDDRFRAASRLAFFLEFGDFQSVRVSGTDALAVNPSLDSLFPSADDRSPGIRAAAYEVVRSGIVRSSGDGVRIHHRHIREWLVAHELSRLESLQIQELIGNGEGELDPLRARIGEALLELPTPKVARDWLDGAFGRFRAKLGESVGDFLEVLLDSAEAAPYGLDAYPRVEELRPLNREAVLFALAKVESRWLAFTNKQKVLLLQIAQDLETPAFVKRAQDSLTDAAGDENLGEQAVEYLGKLNELPDLAALAKLVDPEKKPRFLARVLLTALDSGLMSPLDVLRFRLLRQHGLVDLRATLDQAVADKLTPEAAIWCLVERHENSGWSDVVLERAVGLLASSPIDPTWPSLFAREIRRAADEGRYQDHERWLDVVARNGDLRRALYTFEVAGRGATDLFRVVYSLLPEDLVWLSPLLPTAGTDSVVVRDVYSLASRGNRADVLEHLRAVYPAEVKSIEDSQAQFEREAQERLGRSRRPRPEQLRMEDVLRSELGRHRAPQMLIHQLGWIVFGDWRPNNVAGKFEEIPLDLQEEVLAAARAAMIDAEATPIEPGNSVHGHILYEASVVEAVVGKFGARSLGPEAVRKWLPTLLRGLETDQTVGACSEAFPEQAIEAFIWFIVRDAEEFEGHAFMVSRVPPPLWSLGLEKLAVAVAEYDGLPAVGRASLLKALLEVVPSSALAVAQRWAGSPVLPDPAMSAAATRVLLTLLPSDGLALLGRDLAARGQKALLDQGKTFDSFRRKGVRLQEWSEHDLANLAGVLFEWFPEELHQLPPPGEPYSVTSEHELVDARHAVTRVLRDRSSPSAKALLEHIAQKSPRLRRELRQEEEEGRANALGAELALASGAFPAIRPDGSPSAGKPFRYPEVRRVSLQQLLRLLSSGEYRLARTSADLARVLVEVFAKINEDIPEDISLLFRDDQTGEAKHVSEQILQAYLSRRLEDLMPGRIVDREAWQRYEKRADFLVRVKPDGAPIVGVPIELKWSDHAKVKTAARDQLGALYMGPAKRDNGLLVVAWMGNPGTEATLKASIDQNVRDFEAENPGKHILVSWLVVVPAPAKGRKSS